MEKLNKVSLWLGIFELEKDFRNFVKKEYDEDGNSIPSSFQKSYDIVRYDVDTAEMDWITESCTSLKQLLNGFSSDIQIISQVKDFIPEKNISKYNSIILLYNYEYNTNGKRKVKTENGEMEFIASVNY